MNGSLLLPDRESFVSNVEVAGSQLSIRLVCDYHPKSNQTAYVLAACEIKNCSEAVRFLEHCKTEEACVYAQQDGSAVVLTTESGDELRLEAQSISSSPAPFNESELTEALSRVWSWYELENQALRRSVEQIQAAQAVLIEAERRLEIKSARHIEGTAAVLYSQQLALIRRLLDALRT
ncbi:MAG: hypothetical protein L6Q60_13985 [Rhodocyclaceae bacterium]|nr:hypothetical protein [Rhodocyclaceae bacterium]